MPEQFSNNGESTLNGAITNVATSLIITSAATFPAAGNFRLRIDDEILLVTAVSGTTYTVTRGVEGSSAVAHGNGTLVRQVLTAAGLAQGMAEAGWIVVTKTVDEDVTSSTALQDDDALLTPTLTAGKVYEFEADLLIGNPVGTGGNLKLVLGEDATNRGVWEAIGINTSGNASITTTAINTGATTTWITVSTAKNTIKVWGSFISNGGVLKFQWAQNVSNGNAVRVYAGSVLRYRQVI